MSLGSDQVSTALDNAVTAASKNGIHVSVAAGNSGVDACSSSPAFASLDSSVISVGAIDINDQRASFSNFGQCVTTYAPGVEVISTFIDPKDPANGRNNIINNLSGTSMACPHVTGLIAYYLGKFPDLANDPAGLKKLIVSASEKVASLAPVKGDTSLQGDPGAIVTNLGQLTGNQRRAVESKKRSTRRSRRALQPITVV